VHDSARRYVQLMRLEARNLRGDGAGKRGGIRKGLVKRTVVLVTELLKACRGREGSDLR